MRPPMWNVGATWQILLNLCFLRPTRVQYPNGKSTGSTIFGRPFVKWFALCYRTVVCAVLSVLSVTLVYCGQTVGWINMPLGMEIGLGLCHIVLDGDPAPAQKGAQSTPIFGPCLLWPHGWMDQDATW